MSIFTPGTELKRFRRGALPKVAIAVLLLIPLIYGALYLWAFWAPTDHMDRLPVGVVNLDEPAESPDGETLTAGDDVLEQLLDGGDLQWKTLDADEAARQVSDGDVYFSVTIPRDFSATLAGLQDDPRAGRIDVAYNDANSFLASTLGKQAMVQLRDAVAETTTQTAADKILVGVERLSEGTRDAAEAAGELDDGSKELADAGGRLSAGLGDLADGTSEMLAQTPALADATAQLADGAGRVADGGDDLRNGSAALAGKSGEAADGAAVLNDGLSRLQTGAGDLDSGAAQAAQGSADLADGASDLSAGASRLSSGIGTLSSGLAELDGSVPALRDGADQVAQGTGAIAQLAAANPDMTLAELDAAMGQQGASLADLAEGAQTLSTGISDGVAPATARLSGGAADAAASSQELAAGAEKVDAGAADLKSGTAQVAGGASQLKAGVDEAAGGSEALAGGLSRLSSGASTLAEGGAQLSDGANRVAAGNAQLNEKSGSLVDGASRLHDGARAADEGSTKLAGGADALHDGAEQFAERLDAGAAEAPDFEQGQTDRISETLAAPVQLDETTENAVQGFGGGFAPFFIALASFVGALITWLILRPVPRRPMSTNSAGLRTVLTGFWPAALIGVGQVAIMMLVLVYGIGLRPVHWVGMSLFMLLTTLAFLAMQQMFIVVLGTAPGRVVSLVLLMLQLSSSGGTYPVETTPTFFQILHPFMPASYVVDGLRQLVGGGIDGRFWTALAVMAGVLVGSLVISAVAARRQKVWTVKRLHPELAI